MGTILETHLSKNRNFEQNYILSKNFNIGESFKMVPTWLTCCNNRYSDKKGSSPDNSLVGFLGVSGSEVVALDQSTKKINILVRVN